MGLGYGGGSGGRGNGPDSTDHMAIGGAVCVIIAVMMCLIGLPMLIAGAIFVTVGQAYFESALNVGIGLLVALAVVTAVGILIVILLCCGVCSKCTSSSSVSPMQPQPSSRDFPFAHEAGTSMYAANNNYYDPYGSFPRRPAYPVRPPEYSPGPPAYTSSFPPPQLDQPPSHPDQPPPYHSSSEVTHPNLATN